MARTARVVSIALMLMSPAVAVAGPAEDANAAVDRWSAAFNSSDPETIAKNYCPDAILLGTVSPVMFEGTQAIITYFAPTKRTGAFRKGEGQRAGLHRCWPVALPRIA
jgi:hypothetical protein